MHHWSLGALQIRKQASGNERIKLLIIRQLRAIRIQRFSHICKTMELRKLRSCINPRSSSNQGRAKCFKTLLPKAMMSKRYSAKEAMEWF